MWIKFCEHFKFGSNDLTVAFLDRKFWSDIQQGKDAYPKRRKDLYFIGGGKDRNIKVTAIEIFGVKL